MTEGLLRGVLLILLIEFPDNLEATDAFESPETLRACRISDSVDLIPSVLRKSDGLDMGGKPFLNAMSLAEDADVCCDTGRGTFLGS